MSKHLTTREVAALLRCPLHQPAYMVREGRIPSPRRSPSGAYEWSSRDVARLKKALPQLRVHRRKRKTKR